MNKSVIILLILLFVYSNSNAQEIWTKILGDSLEDSGNCVQLLDDGSFIVVGTKNYIFSNADHTPGQSDIWLLKLNNSGELIWSRTFPGNVHQHGLYVEETKDLGFIILGLKDPNIIVIKADSEGNLLWTKEYGGPQYDYGYMIKEANSGGYFVVGKTHSFTERLEGAIWILRLDSSGELIWSKSIIGESFGAEGRSFVITENDNLIIAGVATSSEDWNKFRDAYVLKVDSQGNVLWDRRYSAINDDIFTSIAKTSDDGYVLGGVSKYDYGMCDQAWLVKINSLGEILWRKTFGDKNCESIEDVKETQDGGFILTGNTTEIINYTSDAYLVKTNNLGEKEWAHSYDSRDYSVTSSVQQTNDGGYILVGTTFSYPSFQDLLLIKTDSQGYSNLPTGIDKVEKLSRTINLSQNYPNPFNPKTRISYSISKQSYVKLLVYDIMGKEVSKLIDGIQNEGIYEIIFNGDNLSSGIYFYVLTTENSSIVKKMSLLK